MAGDIREWARHGQDSSQHADLNDRIIAIVMGCTKSQRAQLAAGCLIMATKVSIRPIELDVASGVSI